MKLTWIHNGSIEVRMEPENQIEQAFLQEIETASAKGAKLVVSSQPENCTVIRLERQ